MPNKKQKENKNILEVFAVAFAKCIPASIYIALSASERPSKLNKMVYCALKSNQSVSLRTNSCNIAAVDADAEADADACDDAASKQTAVDSKTK